jgi:hypothetical protein
LEFDHQLSEAFFYRFVRASLDDTGAYRAKRLETFEGPFYETETAARESGVDTEYEHMFDTTVRG